MIFFLSMLKKIISFNCFEFLMVVASRKNQELYLIDFSNLFLSYRQYTRVVFAIIKQVLLKYNRVLYSLVYDFPFSPASFV